MSLSLHSPVLYYFYIFNINDDDFGHSQALSNVSLVSYELITHVFDICEYIENKSPEFRSRSNCEELCRSLHVADNGESKQNEIAK